MPLAPDGRELPCGPALATDTLGHSYQATHNEPVHKLSSQLSLPLAEQSLQPPGTYT
jgi:hypothetical protein